MTLDDLCALADLCQRRSRSYQAFELATQLQAFCSLTLWQAICAPGGHEHFVNW